MRNAVFILFSVITLGANATTISLDNRSTGSRFLFNFGDFYTIDNHDYGVSIRVPDGSQIMEKGAPDLPLVSTSIIVDGSELGVRLVSSSYKDYSGYLVTPSKGPLTRDINPEDINYTYSDVYSIDQFYPSNIASIKSPFILRDHVGQTIVVNPVQYNPIDGILRVYSEITVETYELNNKVVKSSKKQKKQLNERRVDREFSNIYSHKFINFDSSRYQDLDEQGSMLIICYDSFIESMQPLVDWKNKKGIKTDIIAVSEIGSNATSIQNYITNRYYESDLVYVLLVGDINQIPSPSHEGAPSDPFYGYIDGNDYFPEIMVGRFSAESISHVITQVERTINYERYPTSASWYNYGIGVASSEGQGAGDEGESDYQHLDIIRGKLMDYTYNDVDRIYETNGGSYSMVSNAVNQGRSIINYTGHGWDQGWSSTGFDNSGVNALTNTNKLPFIVSVACVNGAFQNGTSFAEAWLRATDSNGNPTGAIAMAASTVNQQWAQPMEGQDEFNDILVESYESNIKRSFGGLFYNANMLMVESYGSSGESEASHWTLFGDPSVVVRTDSPSDLYVSHNQTVVVGSSSISLIVDSVDGFAALSKDNELLTHGYSDNGQIVLDISMIDLNPGDYDLVVTAYNRIPYEGVISVITPDGPYLVSNNYNIISESVFVNQQVDYGEIVDLSLSIDNVGSESATGIFGLVSSDSEYIQLISNQIAFNDIQAGENLDSSNPISFYVKIGTPDAHIANLTLEIFSDQGTWTAEIPIEIHSPVFEITNPTLIDENLDGNWDPGESADINVTLSNSGSAPFYLTPGAIISTDSDNVDIIIAEQTWSSIAPNQSYLGEFTVYASEQTPQGSIANFTITWGPYSEIDEGCPTDDCIESSSLDFNFSIGLPFNDDLLAPDNLIGSADDGSIAISWSAPVWCDPGYVPDCNGDCYYEGWIGDGLCDDDEENTSASYGYFNCEEFDFDDGDCLSSAIQLQTAEDRLRNNYESRDNREIVTGYNVFRDGSHVGFTELTSYQDSDIAPGVLYCYTVTATYLSGQSLLTDELCITSLGNSFIVGDLNDDQIINIVDVIMMINMVIGNIDLDFNVGDINSDGFIDILDIISIVNIILGPDLNRQYTISNAQIDINESSLEINADNLIAGIEISYSGSFDIEKQFIPKDLIIDFSDNKIIFVSMSRESNLNGLTINYIGAIEINDATVVDWTLNKVNADIVSRKFDLGDSFPNPFNPTTTVPYTLETDSFVDISVYDLNGKIVDNLINEYKDSGSYKVTWNASELSSGIYIIKISAGDFSDYQKVVLVK